MAGKVPVATLRTDGVGEEASDLPAKPTEISVSGFPIDSQMTKKTSAIAIKFAWSRAEETLPTLAPRTLWVAAAFNKDRDSEPEELAPQAKMRVKNIGRDTPPSAGPHSFNKGKHGFLITRRYGSETQNLILQMPMTKTTKRCVLKSGCGVGIKWKGRLSFLKASMRLCWPYILCQSCVLWQGLYFCIVCEFFFNVTVKHIFKA